MGENKTLFWRNNCLIVKRNHSITDHLVKKNPNDDVTHS